ncbi:MAG: lipopolysaccharide heptosyltransferase I [Gammaproteobacteria bacterium]|nr:MAG: lipopolysaccharide heptosyltransferase I [Gammaproteobacteria bacterium]RKZ44037.1 MAG: lipopolysaccharide heptosyltransferase I [Gammaproteobacteria bacterium]RKZ74055.1 MAG: lipopolysaccharide heptosyltransferase I [Gammaproteobacteria bacterium]
MHILIVKTSSLGDVIHTLPALTDASKHYPALQCDWLVEEAFAEIPSWHPVVKRVIPVALRRWRKHLWQTWRNGEWHSFIQTLTQQHYDKIIDAQGLIKSAFLTYQAYGPRCGYDRHSAREPLAALAYQQHYTIAKNQHAVERVRQLFAATLTYPVPNMSPDYGIHLPPQVHYPDEQPIIIFLHGTTWTTKHWPTHYWMTLAERVTTAGYAVRLPWSNKQEYLRAKQIAAIHPNIHLIPKSNLYGIATTLIKARAIVGVDTGLAHLAAALGVPSVTLYGATQPAWTGTYGSLQKHLQADFTCAPCLNKQCTYQGTSTITPACYEALSVEKVWEALQQLCEHASSPL